MDAYVNACAQDASIAQVGAPGTARMSEVTILLSDLTRLKRRKTRKARSVFRKLNCPASAPVDESTEISTMTKSKIFHPERQKLRA